MPVGNDETSSQLHVFRHISGLWHQTCAKNLSCSFRSCRWEHDHIIPMEPIFGSGSAHFGITSGAVPLRRKNISYLFGVVWRVKSWNWCPINFCLKVVPCIQLIVQPDFKHLGSDMVETCVGTPNENNGKNHSFWQKKRNPICWLKLQICWLIVITSPFSLVKSHKFPLDIIRHS